MRPATTWEEVEAAIQIAVDEGIIQDRRKDMPRGKVSGRVLGWGKIAVSDVLGCVIHQGGGRNFTNPFATARYHTSRGNHISKTGYPLPSTVYSVMVPDRQESAYLVSDFSWKTWAHGAGDGEFPGDENRHLKGILVMGGFYGSGLHRGYMRHGPSTCQRANLIRVVGWMMEVFGFGVEGVFGHYHFGKAGCPGDALESWVEELRATDDHLDLETDLQWQRALLRWNPHCLPEYGADGIWGLESKRALIAFQRAHGIRVTASQDPFTELLLRQRYPDRDGDAVLDLGPDASTPLSDATGAPETVVYPPPGTDTHPLGEDDCGATQEPQEPEED